MAWFGCGGRVRMTLAALVVSLGALAPVASANTPTGATGPVWSDAVNWTGGQSVLVTGLSCPSAGNCVAVGTLAIFSVPGTSVPVVGVETNGSWGTIAPLALPADWDSSKPAAAAAVACPSPTACYATGEYTTKGGVTTGVVIPLTVNGGTATSGTAQSIGANDALTDISCTGSGVCAGAGGHLDPNSQAVTPIVAGSSGSGTWVTTAVTPPAAASSGIGLTAVACPPDASGSAVSCQAIGDYTDATHGQHAWTVELVGGVPGTGVDIPMPSDFYAGAGTGATAALTGATPGGISCPASRTCTADLSYLSAGGATVYPAVTSITSGVPGVATPLPGAGQGVLQGIACPDVDTCVAVGDSLDLSLNTNPLTGLPGLIARRSGGTWTTVNPPSAGALAIIDGISCTSADDCVVRSEDQDNENGFRPFFYYSASPMTTDTSSLPAATVGTPYHATLGATGGNGPLSWSISSGSLPAGLGLDPATGVIAGTPTTAGTTAGVATVMQAGVPAQTATTPFAISVSPASTTSGTTGVTGTTGTAGTVKLVIAETSGAKARLVLSCTGGPCAGTLRIAGIEHLKGKRITAVVAATKQRSVTLAGASYAVGANATQVVNLTLASKAAKLLAKLNKLSGNLSITPTGAAKPAVTRTITFRSAKRKHTSKRAGGRGR